MTSPFPRVVVAGLSGDAGKTLVSTGLARALRARGRRVAVFKKGPDYIDAAWLAAAVGGVARNLDSYLMPADAILASVAGAATGSDVGVVEGNRGLFDGLDAQGSHSTAALARLIGAPVVLVVDASKATRTVAALVLGCRLMEPNLDLAGVILNRVATSRQEAVIREAVEAAAGVAVLGAVPRIGDLDLPARHLGLVTVAEHPRAEAMIERAAGLVERYCDVPGVLDVAGRAAPLESRERPASPPVERRARVGVLRDAAFSFYYPENLEALEQAGAELVPISPLADSELPDVDALYAGGGFPEIYARNLADNAPLRHALAARIQDGLPVWAECGGLMYLAEKLVVGGESHEMVGALPVVVEQTGRPQGHGYVCARVDGANPFFGEGSSLRGHEFHYSRLRQGLGAVRTVMAVDRGVGLGEGRDGLQVGSVVASYTHLHAAGAPEWGPALVRAAQGWGS